MAHGHRVFHESIVNHSTHEVVFYWCQIIQDCVVDCPVLVNNQDDNACNLDNEDEEYHPRQPSSLLM